MGVFNSFFGIDITGNGKADMLDDMLLMELMEEDKESDDELDLDDEGEDEI